MWTRPILKTRLLFGGFGYDTAFIPEGNASSLKAADNHQMIVSWPHSIVTLKYQQKSEGGGGQGPTPAVGMLKTMGGVAVDQSRNPSS